MDKQFHPSPYSECNNISLPRFKLIHVSKRGPRCRTADTEEKQKLKMTHFLISLTPLNEWVSNFTFRYSRNGIHKSPREQKKQYVVCLWWAQIMTSFIGLITWSETDHRKHTFIDPNALNVTQEQPLLSYINAQLPLSVVWVSLMVLIYLSQSILKKQTCSFQSTQYWSHTDAIQCGAIT